MEYLSNNNINDKKSNKKDIVDEYLINDPDANIQKGGIKKKKNKIVKTPSKKNNITKKNVKTEKKPKIDYQPRNIYQNLKFKLEPIKVIFKYKNSNRKNQYETYIFVGTIGKRYESIFSRIEKLNLYETLKEITTDEEKSLSNGFGEFWMTKFFNIYHISEFVNKIEQNSTIKTDLLKKYDDRWLQNFINKFKSDVVFKKVYYSYSDLIKFQYKVKMGKKIEKIEIEKEDVEELNFKIQDKSKNILYNKPNIADKNQTAGDYSVHNESDDSDNSDNSHNSHNSHNNLTDGEQDTVDVVDMYDTIEEDTGETLQEELNLDEIAKIYQQDEVDTNLKNTTNLISNILEDDKILERKEIYMCTFSEERDDNLEHQTLEDAYTKKFVYNHYIYKDDTIKMVRNKITCSIMNNSKFGKENYIIPSRMYLWSEYIINEKIEKIMIGQRWLKKNELLSIDIEPLQISKYENLDGQIKNLRDTLKRYGGKIRREDEDSNILYDYENYIANDEIYMCDIYNELGDKYTGNADKIVNLTDTYFKIYFPKIKSEDIRGIIDYLLGDTKIEDTRIKNTFDTLYNDLIIEKEIMDLIEMTKIDESNEYTQVFESGNFITQSVIHVNLEIYDRQLEEENKENMNKLNKITGEFGAILLPKLDLFRIFNDFTPTDRYPFIQYQMTDGQIIFKYFDDYMYEFSKTKDNVDMITKWFENSPYGISFKVKLHDNKFMAINVNDIGKIEYKTQWKEEDGANINDVINTYSFVKDLVSKINETLINHPRKVHVRVPEDWEFRFAFINCIQKFKLPENKIIDHNDLSDFASFFFPYIALVIEPRKRTSKLSSKEEKSKYGSYLRYKRVSKFENAGRIEQRILSYIRNFDFEDDILIDEISKQFNITQEKAKEEVTKVRTQFPSVGKLKKPIKKMDSMPKFKPPGIGIDIQGKVPEKYKIRISGAREQKQLERIITFMNVLIYLYAETYILKKPERQEIKIKLSKLTNIAKRRSKVDEIVDYQKEVNMVKQMAQLDKKRLGFTPDEGQNQWTRSCQNSGNDKKRRPQQIILKNISDLVKKGYILNKKSGDYEKRVLFKKKGKREGEIVLKAIKVTDQDEQANGNEIFYTCDPEDNGEHMFVGFLTRSNNPFGECMPCCFKKNRIISKKKETIDFYKRCTGEKSKEDVLKPVLAVGDILYILQDTNKIQENRISYLPKFIDWFTNIQFKKQRDIKNHYLLRTDGYYFKFGIKQENYSFLNTLESVLNTPINEIKNIIIEFLKKDTDQLFYYSLNDGDIRAEYQINDFINFVKDSEHLDFYYLKDLLKIPGLFTKNGIYPIVLNKITQIIKRGNERERIKDDFYVDVDKTMVDDFEFCLKQMESMDILFMMRESKFFYPIVQIVKSEEYSKNIKIIKMFTKSNSNDNLIPELQNYFTKTIQDIQIDYISTHKSARATFVILTELSQKHKEFEVKFQVVDSRFKCKYLITKNGTVVPVVPSGIITNVPTICFDSGSSEKKRADCFTKLKFHNLDDSNKNLEKIYKLSEKKLNIKPIGVFYDSIDDNNMVNVIGIITSNNDLVPIQKVQISKKELDKSKVQYQNRPLYHELDQKLATYNKDSFQIIDSRIKNVNLDKYKNEAYQLFKFELSNLINTKEYSSYKKELKEFINNKDLTKIQDLFLNICVNKLDTKIISKNTVGPELVRIIQDIPNLDYYKIDNQRKICENLDENKCSANAHCKFHNGKCSFSLTQEYLLEFIKKTSVEIVEQEIKALELLKENKYFVSDIVDFNNFTEKPGQKIIKSTNTNLAKILTDMFGKEHVPKIGKRHIGKKIEVDLQILQTENPLKDIKDAFQQSIIPYNYSILRAYCNGYYWIKHSLYATDGRNLGFYSELQNEIINIFRSLIIDWLNIPDNVDLLENLDDKTKSILKHKLLFVDNRLNKRILINTYIIELMEKSKESNLGLLEVFILNKIHNISICYMINGAGKYFINNKIIEIKNNDSQYQKSENICINIELHSGTSYPYAADIIYYK
jgi:hypothetical protein